MKFPLFPPVHGLLNYMIHTCHAMLEWGCSCWATNHQSWKPKSHGRRQIPWQKCLWLVHNLPVGISFSSLVLPRKRTLLVLRAATRTLTEAESREAVVRRASKKAAKHARIPVEQSGHSQVTVRSQSGLQSGLIQVLQKPRQSGNQWFKRKIMFFL